MIYIVVACTVISIILGFISMANEDFWPFSIAGNVILSGISIVILFIVGSTFLAILTIVGFIAGLIGTFISMDFPNFFSVSLTLGSILIKVVVAVLIFF